MRCATAVAPNFSDGAEPLKPFEISYCARPEIKALTTEIVKANSGRD